MGKRSWLGWLGPKRSLLDLEAFRERVAATVLAAHPAASIERAGDQTLFVTLEHAEEEPTTLNCARIHGLYCQAPEELDRLVAQLAGAVEAQSEVATIVALRVLIRPDTYLMALGHEDDTQLSRPLAGDLYALVAIDSPNAVSFPVASKLRADLGLDDAAIWAHAVENTRSKLPHLELPPPREVCVIICEEGEATGLLALESDWRRLDEETDDGILVLPAEKNVLCMISGFDAEAMPALREIIDIAKASPDHLSSTPLTRRDGRWIEAIDLDPAFDPEGPKH